MLQSMKNLFYLRSNSWVSCTKILAIFQDKTWKPKGWKITELKQLWQIPDDTSFIDKYNKVSMVQGYMYKNDEFFFIS